MSFLNQHQLLTNEKRIFNPKNKKDIDTFKSFILKNRWGDPCPFLLEEPYLNIPDMLKDKFIKNVLGL
jgi:hypothetical protein